MVVGSSFPAVAFSMRVSPSGEIRHQQYSAGDRGLTYFFAGYVGRVPCSERRMRRARIRRRLELDVGLREQSALEQLRVRRPIELLEGDDDTEPATSPLTPVGSTEHVAAL